MKFDALNAFREIQWLANGETVQSVVLSWATMNLVSMNLASFTENLPALPKEKADTPLSLDEARQYLDYSLQPYEAGFHPFVAWTENWIISVTGERPTFVRYPRNPSPFLPQA
ncbi:hypothetical protein ABDF71_24930 [Ochrobactrum sp. WV_118_8]